MSSERPANRARLYLALSLLTAVLGLVSLAIAISDPHWVNWARVVVSACVAASLFLTYRQRR
ncbi:hypothetical protein ACIA49_35330 [Kribbella sp. NPDC051587]|uniref:hypothetical protein n=1 Tax=Kribbella sp. NPDC051587 TaxID=3364119 RepID=UPI0037A2C441